MTLTRIGGVPRIVFEPTNPLLADLFRELTSNTTQDAVQLVSADTFDQECVDMEKLLALEVPLQGDMRAYFEKNRTVLKMRLVNRALKGAGVTLGDPRFSTSLLEMEMPGNHSDAAAATELNIKMHDIYHIIEMSRLHGEDDMRMLRVVGVRHKSTRIA